MDLGAILVLLGSIAGAALLVWLGRASRSGEIEWARAEAEKETKARREAEEVTNAVLRLGEAQATARLETAAALARVRAAPLGSSARAALVRQLLLAAGTRNDDASGATPQAAAAPPLDGPGGERA